MPLIPPDDHGFYYDCTRWMFRNQWAAIDFFVKKHGYLPDRIYYLPTGWMVGPVPQETLQTRAVTGERIKGR